MPFLVFFLVAQACTSFDPIPTSTQVPVTAATVEGTSSPTQTLVPFTLTALEETSSPTQTQMPPTLVDATASPTLITTPFTDLFPRLEVIDVENVTRLQMVATMSVGTDVVCFSPDGKQLAVGSIEIWDLASGQLSLDLESNGVSYLSFSPDGKFLFARADYDPEFNDAVVIWDLSSGQKVRTLDVLRAAISPDWRVLATQPLEPESIYASDDIIQLTDFERNIRLGVLKDPSRSIMDVAFSPNGRMLAMMLVGVEDAAIKVWDVRSMQMLASLDELLWLAFSPDGEFAAGVSWRPEMTIFETRTWTEIVSLSGDKDDVGFNSPVFTPDSSMVAGTFSGQIKLFETGTWKELVTLSAPDRPNYLAFSPDGRLLASYGGSENKVLLWGVVP